MPGDVFVVEDIVNESWFWGRLQRTGERGMIPRNYTVDAVSGVIVLIIFFKYTESNNLSYFSEVCPTRSQKGLGHTPPTLLIKA